MTKTYATIKGEFYFAYTSKGKIIRESFKCLNNGNIGYLTTSDMYLITYIESRSDFGTMINLIEEYEATHEDEDLATKVRLSRGKNMKSSKD